MRADHPAPNRLELRKCPFCGENDFDAYGLKQHLRMGWCDAFEAISESDRFVAAVPDVGQGVGGGSADV